jgi:quinoprotein glucose dehydrogenase
MVMKRALRLWLLSAAAVFFGLLAVDAPAQTGTGAQDPTDWQHYGGTLSGQRYAPSVQIDASNVSRLEVASIFQTGDDPAKRGPASFEATPLKVGARLYMCTPSDQILALDAASGQELWRFGQKRPNTCRGVAYYRASPAAADCPERIFKTTRDNRLVAVDAASGTACASFGEGGSISLVADMGPQARFGYSAAPTVVSDLVVLGGSTAGSGVIRAFSALTGKLAWAWDAGRPMASDPPYTKGTPNSWTTFSADPASGMVYVLTGIEGGALSGKAMTEEGERFGDSVVALDLATGAVRWSFQTVHHDVWDYDSGSQPNLVDLQGQQGTIPVLVQPTKSGELFVLDRRTGVPVSRVVETPMPQGAAPGETLSATQPVSVDMPSLRMDRSLTEADMWGATPFDQLWCRIKFRQLRYDGIFTPPTVGGTLFDPGDLGVVNWGSAAVDPKQQFLIVNTNWAPWRVRLVPRAEFTKDHPPGTFFSPMPKPGFFVFPQADTPYAAESQVFLSPFGIPCNAPPWGHLVAIDLAGKRVVWTRPFGTTGEKAPLGLPLPLGDFSHGGPIVTASGVVFIGAAMDDYIRAFDERTGKELWRAKLPAGGQATPITYTVSGRQYVVIVAGGNGAMQTKGGDYVVAYRLPDN